MHTLAPSLTFSSPSQLSLTHSVLPFSSSPSFFLLSSFFFHFKPFSYLTFIPTIYIFFISSLSLLSHLLPSIFLLLPWSFSIHLTLRLTLPLPFFASYFPPILTFLPLSLYPYLSVPPYFCTSLTFLPTLHLPFFPSLYIFLPF